MLGWVALPLHPALTQVTWCSAVGGWCGLRVQIIFSMCLMSWQEWLWPFFPLHTVLASPPALLRKAIELLHSALLRTLKGKGGDSQSLKDWTQPWYGTNSALSHWSEKSQGNPESRRVETDPTSQGEVCQEFVAILDPLHVGCINVDHVKWKNREYKGEGGTHPCLCSLTRNWFSQGNWAHLEN